MTIGFLSSTLLLNWKAFYTEFLDLNDWININLQYKQVILFGLFWYVRLVLLWKRIYLDMVYSTK